MRLISKTPNQTIDIGKKIARNLKAGDIVCLFGNLGSGKTVLTKGIAAGLKIPRSQIISPTFVFIREYNSSIPLYHFDLYRLKEMKELINLGYTEYLYDEGISVIEWADRMRSLLPDEFLKIELFLRNNNERLLVFSARGSRYHNLLERLDEDIRH